MMTTASSATQTNGLRNTLPTYREKLRGYLTDALTSICNDPRSAFETGHFPSASMAVFANVAASMPCRPSAMTSSDEDRILIPASVF